jgi:hypothetical protein
MLFAISRILLLFSILHLTSSGYGQHLVFRHEQQHEEIQAGHFIALHLVTPDVTGECSKCPGRWMSGRLIDYKNQTLQLAISEARIPEVKDCQFIKYMTLDYSGTTSPKIDSIPLKDILTITYLGKKKAREHCAGDVIATIFMATGFGHLVSLPVVEKEHGKLALATLAEWTMAAVLGTVSKQRSYALHSDGLQFASNKKKIWTLE